MTQISRKRKGERGITILLVAVAMISILAMAALAVDVVALYVARSETQRAADAAALAAAKMFAFSGYTSNSSIITQGQLCVSGGSGNSAASNQAAQSAVSQNLVSGQVASIQTITCDFSQAENPRVTVTIQRTGLPTFFGRIWGAGAGSVSATASAEAFNPSGGSVNIAVGSVKPWLIPNCLDPTCSGLGEPYFFTSANGIANSGSFIGQAWTFARQDANTGAPTPPAPNSLPTPPPPTASMTYGWYYAIDPPEANVCPSTGALNCNQLFTGPPNIYYHDNIACSNTAFQYSCGQQIGPGSPGGPQPVVFDGRPAGFLTNRTQAGVACMIHSTSGTADLGNGQDVIATGTPVVITGGTNSPNASLNGVVNISRSDSVVTVPVYAGGDPCPSNNSVSTCSAIVIGFLQIAVQGVVTVPIGGGLSRADIQAVITNAAGCNPANNGPAVAGGALSPLPVRLIR